MVVPSPLPLTDLGLDVTRTVLKGLFEDFGKVFLTSPQQRWGCDAEGMARREFDDVIEPRNQPAQDRLVQDVGSMSHVREILLFSLFRVRPRAA